MTEIHILVVDDEPFNLDIIGETLDDPSYRLCMAETGEAAWEILGDHTRVFDLVVLDRMLPGMDGIEVLRRIKAEPRLAAMPVIMQTAAASPDQVREGVLAGAHYYLTKPFALETLQTIVRAAIDDARRRRSLLDDISDQGRALGLVEGASFRLQSLDEARRLAALLARLFRDPQLGAMGLSEMLVNAIEHGNLGIDFHEKSRLKEQDCWQQEVERRLALPENREKYVRIEIARVGAEWEFLIADQGEGFAWADFLEFSPERAFAPNGRGIVLARQLAFSSMEFEGGGNCVRMRAAIPESFARDC